jgi:hypothetical protein
MRWTLRIAISSMLLAVAGVAKAGSEDEVKALFGKVVAAQNAYDLKAVGEFCRTRLNFCGSLVAHLSGVATQHSSALRRYIKVLGLSILRLTNLG